jgi:Uma2 family endonuclease
LINSSCCFSAWSGFGATARIFDASDNLTVYYSPKQRKSEDSRGTDFFVVLGTERNPRKSSIVWEEGGKYPNVIIELLSESTAETDRGFKKQICQDTFRTPDYFCFDPDSQQLRLFLGIQEQQLRFFTPEGQIVLTPEEIALAEQRRVEAAQQQDSEAEARTEKLAAKLRELGIDSNVL